MYWKLYTKVHGVTVRMTTGALYCSDLDTFVYKSSLLFRLLSSPQFCAIYRAFAGARCIYHLFLFYCEDQSLSCVILIMRSVKAFKTKVENKGQSPPHSFCLRPYLPVPDTQCLRHCSFTLICKVTSHKERKVFPVRRHGSTTDISIRSIISYHFNSCSFLRSIKIQF